jgi:hypothetical protein
MENVTLSEVLAPQQVWDYALYGIFAVQVVVLGLLFSASLRDVLMIAFTVLCLIADKAYIFGFLDGGANNLPAAIEYHTTESPFTFGVRIAMFALPLIITTQTKIPKAKPALILLSIISLVYAGLRWFIQVFPEAQGDTDRGVGSLLNEHHMLAANIGITFLSYKLLNLGKTLPVKLPHRKKR